MADFKGLVYTNKGAELIAKSIGDKETITITKMVTTDLMYNESQIKILEEINEQKQTIPQLSVTKVEGSNKVQVFAAFRNTKLDEGYYLRAYGIYAKTDTTQEILFAVASVDDKNKGDWINASSGLNIVDVSITSVMVLSNVKLQELLITADGGVTIEQFEKHTLMKGNDNVHGATSEPSENSIIARTAEGYAKANYPDDETDIDENTIITKKKLKVVEEKLQSEIDKNLNPNNVLRFANSIDELQNFHNGETVGILNSDYGDIASTSSIRVIYDYRDNKYINRYKRVKTEHSIYMIDYGRGIYWGIPQYNTNSNMNVGIYNSAGGLSMDSPINMKYYSHNNYNTYYNDISWVGWNELIKSDKGDFLKNTVFKDGFNYRNSIYIPVDILNIELYWDTVNLLLDFKDTPKESLHNRLKIVRDIDNFEGYYNIYCLGDHYAESLEGGVIVNYPMQRGIIPFNIKATGTTLLGLIHYGDLVNLDTIYKQYQIDIAKPEIIFIIDRQNKIGFSHPIMIYYNYTAENMYRAYSAVTYNRVLRIPNSISLQLMRKEPDDGKLYWYWIEMDPNENGQNITHLTEITEPDTNPTKELYSICAKIQSYYAYRALPVCEPINYKYLYDNKLVQAGPSGDTLYFTDLFLYPDRLEPLDYVN